MKTVSKTKSFYLVILSLLMLMPSVACTSHMQKHETMHKDGMTKNSTMMHKDAMMKEEGMTHKGSTMHKDEMMKKGDKMEEGSTMK